ncbi:DUF1330 domain-containing protein [Epidermidibacterium keratini]|uniref:DUF1330 domain-containing protein n=1 Tax=Epidermidibacterium keratini TaxID=1891644 RepID=A0A7L4YP24_9ACTN|nr:DUF1330 domain-containing protein [Epidermidibacterium keratini]QHC01025.1 DUF1330 domain-containing protein [Epidermidibacterium keratini]
MAKAYWIARVEVSDEDAYGKYRDANAEAFEKYDARFVVRGGPFEVMEGEGRGRNVVVEFDSYQQAVDCYNSPEYQRAKAFRDGAADVDLIIIEGPK